MFECRDAEFWFWLTRVTRDLAAAEIGMAEEVEDSIACSNLLSRLLLTLDSVHVAALSSGLLVLLSQSSLLSNDAGFLFSKKLSLPETTI